MSAADAAIAAIEQQYQYISNMFTAMRATIPQPMMQPEDKLDALRADLQDAVTRQDFERMGPAAVDYARGLSDVLPNEPNLKAARDLLLWAVECTRAGRAHLEEELRHVNAVARYARDKTNPIPGRSLIG